MQKYGALKGTVSQSAQFSCYFHKGHYCLNTFSCSTMWHMVKWHLLELSLPFWLCKPGWLSCLHPHLSPIRCKSTSHHVRKQTCDSEGRTGRITGIGLPPVPHLQSCGMGNNHHQLWQQSDPWEHGRVRGRYLIPHPWGGAQKRSSGIPEQQQRGPPAQSRARCLTDRCIMLPCWTCPQNIDLFFRHRIHASELFHGLLFWQAIYLSLPPISDLAVSSFVCFIISHASPPLPVFFFTLPCVFSKRQCNVGCFAQQQPTLGLPWRQKAVVSGTRWTLTPSHKGLPCSLPTACTNILTPTANIMEHIYITANKSAMGSTILGKFFWS